MSSKIPVKLNDSKLVSVSFELRFESGSSYTDLTALDLINAVKTLENLNNDSVFQLPAMQLPILVRANDPSLRYSSLFGIKKGDLIVQAGPRALVIATENYPGWNAFFESIRKILECTNGLRLKTERIGLRTTNFFESQDIEKSLTTTINNGVQLKIASCNFSLVYEQGENRSRLSFSNDAKMSRNGTSELRGSFIDIDSYYEGEPNDIFTQVDSLHALGKKVFFESMKDDFIQSMGPVYGT